MRKVSQVASLYTCWSKSFAIQHCTNIIGVKAEYCVDSCVRGYHYYQNIWDPFIGEVLSCLQEDGNPYDMYAVVVNKSSHVVGYVPRKISTLCYMFLRRGGTISSIVKGTRRYSYNLPQGGMEIPCKLKFSCTCDDTKSLQKIKHCRHQL